MNNEIIRIECYNHENQNDYKKVLNAFEFPRDFNILSKQTFEQKNKNIFLMIIDYPKIFLNFGTKTKIIGYCIIYDAHDFPKEHQKFLFDVFNVPANIVHEYNIIVSDCMISAIKRGKGYGDKLINHVLCFYKGDKISLYADNAYGDSSPFWIKMGFNIKDEENSIYALDNSVNNV
ncbi:MAG: hypothetical protein FWD34_06660 [Oscillospiraceae bacterium]|nr:hypothetical protein [Oscillospiraceae bacterium]